MIFRIILSIAGFLLVAEGIGAASISNLNLGIVMPFVIGVPTLFFLLKGVDFIMMISVKDICFGSLLVHSVFLPVSHVSLPHSA